MTGAPNTDETLQPALEEVRRLLVSDVALAGEKVTAGGDPGQFGVPVRIAVEAIKP